MLVRNYMTTSVTTLQQEATLLDAALLIRQTGKRHVPIVDGENRLVGIISDRDVARMAPSMLGNITPEEYNHIFETTPITRAMTRTVLSVAPDTRIEEAVTLLHAKKIGALPVLEDGRVVGILTTTDMLGLLHQLLEGQERVAEAGA